MLEILIIMLLILALIGIDALKAYLFLKWSPSAQGSLSDLDKLDFKSNDLSK